MISELFGQIPYAAEQGIILEEQGISTQEQGVTACPVVSVHFSHTCFAGDERDLFSSSICRWRERDGGEASSVDAPERRVLASAS
jgi:hypothetical protein